MNSVAGVISISNPGPRKEQGKLHGVTCPFKTFPTWLKVTKSLIMFYVFHSNDVH